MGTLLSPSQECHPFIPSDLACDLVVSPDVKPGTKITLTAKGDSNSVFTGWLGGNCSGTGKCVVVLNADTAVTAEFSAKAPNISISPSSLDFGTIKAGKKLTKTLKIANNGTGDLIITISGIEGTDFGIRGSSNVTVKPKRSYTLNITFKPTPTGSQITMLEINSNDNRTPVLNIPLSGTDQTQLAVIGSEGGTVTGNNGTQAIIPPGATDENLAAAISPVLQEDLKIDSSEGIEVLGAVYFYIGDKVLKNNSELVIPKSDNLSTDSGILLGRIIHLPDKDLVIMVDTARVEGNSIKTGTPAFPGAILSGTYVFYQNNTPCGVPDYQRYFAGKINPTCTDKLYLHIYLRMEEPILFNQIQNLSKYIDGALNSNDAAQSVISIADTLATLNNLGGKSDVELLTDSAGEMTGFMGAVYGGYWDVIALWVPLITCPITGSCAQQLAVTVAQTWFNAWAATQVIYLGEEINNNLIAERFLETYYGYGRNQTLMAQSLGLAPGADMDSIVNAVAKTVVNDPWWWPYPSYDINRIKDIISAAQGWVASLVRSCTPWLSFVEGNPGIPGDGIVINANGGSYSDVFELAAPIPLDQFTNGFTSTIFMPPNTQGYTETFVAINPINASKPCDNGGMWMQPDSSFQTFFNNTWGFAGNFSESNILRSVDDAILFIGGVHPECTPKTISDFYINKIWLVGNQNPPFSHITTLDAAIILPGQNAVP